jgi:branched-chain amino acid transport system substrate-binding protein
VKGDFSARAALTAAMQKASFASPRGPMSFNKANNPIQNIYLREVRNGRNEMISVAGQAVDDPARGCRVAS